MSVLPGVGGAAGPGGGPVGTVCSSKGCRQDAVFALLWNNPSLHTPERRKVWLACDDHREDLVRFLSVRGLLKDVVPVDAIPEGAG